MKPLEIGETATLENGDVVKCVESNDKKFGCRDCYLKYKESCTENTFRCNFRKDRKLVHFELVEKIPQSVEEIRKE